MKQRLHVTYEVTAEMDTPQVSPAIESILKRHVGPLTIRVGPHGVYPLGKFKLVKIVRKK